MTRERELDLDIAVWVTSAVVRTAPTDVVRAALVEVGRTRQRRRFGARGRTRPWLPGSGSELRGRAALAIVAAVLAMVGALALAAGMLDLLDPPVPSASPLPSHAAPSSAPAGPISKYLWFDKNGLALRVPISWNLVEGGPADVVRVAGLDPAGSMAVSHSSATRISLCDPECTSLDIPQYLPLNPDRMLSAVQREISGHVGGAEWRPAEGLSGNLIDPRRLDLPAGASQPRRTYVVAAYLTGVIVIVLTADQEALTDERFEQLLATVRPSPLEGAKTGGPVPYTEQAIGIEILVPDILEPDAPVEGLRARTFGGGRVSVSTSGPDAILSICAPTCRPILVSDLASLEAAVFRPEGSGIEHGETTIAGVPARYELETTTISQSYRAITIIDGAAVHVWVDMSADFIALSIAQSIVASVEYARPPVSVRTANRITGDGFALALPTFWQGDWNPGREGGISVVSGDARGRFWTCRWSGFDGAEIPCSIEHAATLEELVRAMAIDGTPQEVVLDGEPAVVKHVQTYEYPARGGQWLAYILAVHDGQPFVIRLHNRQTASLQVEDVIAGFRFTD